MTDYNNAQIYKIVSPNHAKVYYGATCKTLNVRFGFHRRDCNCTSREIIAAGGAEIKHIEWFPCDNKEALQDREAYFIMNDRDGCVNMGVPGAVRRAGGLKAYNKVYLKAYNRKPECKAVKRAYSQTPECKAAQRAYSQTPECKASQKKYQQTPKAKAVRKAYRETPVQCACGKTITQNNIRAHQRTKKCKAIIESEVHSVLNSMIDLIVEHSNSCTPS